MSQLGNLVHAALTLAGHHWGKSGAKSFPSSWAQVQNFVMLLDKEGWELAGVQVCRDLPALARSCQHSQLVLASRQHLIPASELQADVPNIEFWWLDGVWECLAGTTGVL